MEQKYKKIRYLTDRIGKIAHKQGVKLDAAMCWALAVSFHVEAMNEGDDHVFRASDYSKTDILLKLAHLKCEKFPTKKQARARADYIDGVTRHYIVGVDGKHVYYLVGKYAGACIDDTPEEATIIPLYLKG